MIVDLGLYEDKFPMLNEISFEADQFYLDGYFKDP